MKLNKKEINRILVIGGHGLGDNLFAAKVIIATIRRNFPSSLFIYCLEPASAKVLEGNPWADKILPADRQIVSRIIKMGAFDLAIDTVGHADTARVCYLSGAKYRVGCKTGMPETRLDLYNIILKGRRINHGSIPYHDFMFIAQSLGLKLYERSNLIFLKKDEIDQGRRLLEKLGFSSRDFVVGMQPLGTRKKILWEPEKFAEIAKLLIERNGVKVLLFSAQKDRKETKALAVSVNHANCLIAPTLSIRKWLSLISFCNLFISMDRGPMHVAAHLGVPTVGIFGPFSPKEWFPYPRAKGNLYITKGLSCRYCGPGYRFCRDPKCLRLLSVAEVYAKLCQMMRLKRRKNNGIRSKV